jgi:hypothetical protein
LKRCSSRLFADLNNVPVRIVDLEELGTSGLLDWARRGVSDAKIFVSLLHIGAEKYSVIALAFITGLLNFSPIAEQDSGSISPGQL